MELLECCSIFFPRVIVVDGKEPGDQLIMDVSLDRMKSGIFKFTGTTRVGDAIACEAQLMCTMRTIA